MLADVHHQALKRLAVRMRAELPAMTEETIAIVHRDHAALTARVGAADVRIGIAHTHERFVRILEGDDDGGGANVDFGEAAAAMGASVEALMAGYRVGAQVGWRRVVALADELSLPGPVALHVASLSMSFMDELTANSLEGFAREAQATQGARARARQALLDALLDGATTVGAGAAAGGAEAIGGGTAMGGGAAAGGGTAVGGDDGAAETRALEAAAGWAIPERVRVAVLLAAETARLDDRALLLGRAGGVAVAVAAVGSEALAHTPHAAGPEVAAQDAATSLRGARRLAELVVAGVLPGERPLRWDDHLADLVVHADTAAAQALAQRRLAPLADPSPARETLLRETLAAWLDHPGRPREIARDLHLHHQTVRYRLARLRERLGDDALDDPQARFELQLALRASPTPPPARS
jgi:hypothetical protein